MKRILVALLALTAAPASAVTFSGVSTEQSPWIPNAVDNQGVIYGYKFEADTFASLSVDAYLEWSYYGPSNQNTVQMYYSPLKQVQNGNTVWGFIEIPEITVPFGYTYQVRNASVSFRPNFGTSDPVAYSFSLFQSTVPEPATWAMLIVGAK